VGHGDREQEITGGIVVLSPLEWVEITSSDQIGSEFLRGLYEYWEEKAAGRRCPARSDLSPEDMLRWLGSISLLDVIDDGDDMVYRLVGVDVVNVCGMEYRNKRVSEIDWGDRRDQIIEEYRYVARTRRPLLVHSALVSRDRLYHNRMVPKLMLPLGDEAGKADKLMTCFELNPEA